MRNVLPSMQDKVVDKFKYFNIFKSNHLKYLAELFSVVTRKANFYYVIFGFVSSVTKQ